jgi:hypothetical protein
MVTIHKCFTDEKFTGVYISISLHGHAEVSPEACEKALGLVKAAYEDFRSKGDFTVVYANPVVRSLTPS